MKVSDIRNVGQNPHDYIRAILHYRNDCEVAHNTYANVNDDDSVSVWFHGTEIVRAYRNGRTIVRNGGWFTGTTKARINGFLPSRTRIAQINFEWSVWYQSNGHYTDYKRMVDFTDGMVLMFDSVGRLESWGNQMSRATARLCHEVATLFVFGTGAEPTLEAIRDVAVANGYGALVAIDHWRTIAEWVTGMRQSGLHAA